MGRGKVELKRIENKISRQVTFSKRRSGLLKKANEISVLCEAQVALLIFSSKDKLFEYATASSVDKILERYERYCHAGIQLDSGSQLQERRDMEYPKLVSRLDILQRSLRNHAGDDIDSLSMKELQHLEHQIDVALKRIRIKKVKEKDNIQARDKVVEQEKNQRRAFVQPRSNPFSFPLSIG